MEIKIPMGKYSLMVDSPRCQLVNGSAACISSCTYFHITSKLDPKHEESTIKEIPNCTIYGYVSFAGHDLKASKRSEHPICIYLYIIHNGACVYNKSWKLVSCLHDDVDDSYDINDDDADDWRWEWKHQFKSKWELDEWDVAGFTFKKTTHTKNLSEHVFLKFTLKKAPFKDKWIANTIIDTIIIINRRLIAFETKD